jgi:hypothetical protein
MECYIRTARKALVGATPEIIILDRETAEQDYRTTEPAHCKNIIGKCLTSKDAAIHLAMDWTSETNP